MSRAFQPLVLCYHAVSERWPHALALPEAELLSQVQTLLSRGFRPAGAEEVVAGRGRLLHVTFDDAFRSIERVLPVLERLGVRSTVFVSSSFADEGRTFAVPELAHDAAAFPDELGTMRWDELRELAERGVEVGSHTVTHPHLTRLAGDELERELRVSRERVESELDRACRFLAYPYGEEGARVQAAARAAGYEAAFALPGRERPFDRYALPRVGVYRGQSALRFRVKTTPALRRTAAAVLRVSGRR